MSYTHLLEEWYQREKAAGRVVDFKFFEIDPPASSQALEASCEVVYKAVTGETANEVIDLSLL